jgi:hypothetical protein
MRGSQFMLFSYLTMIGVPILLWIISVTSPFPQTAPLREVLAILVGTGSIVFGAVGMREVFLHGGEKTNE